MVRLWSAGGTGSLTFGMESQRAKLCDRVEVVSIEPLDRRLKLPHEISSLTCLDRFFFSPREAQSPNHISRIVHLGNSFHLKNENLYRSCSTFPSMVS